VGAAGNRFPGHLQGLVQVGAKTGRLSQVLGRFVAYLNVGVELRRRLWVSMAYPILLLAAALVLFAFVSTTIVGSFENIFKDFGVPLPAITIVLIQFAHLFGNDWWRVAVLAGLIVVLIVVFRVMGKRTRRALVGGIPLVGSVSRNTALAEFCHLLGLLLESEMPLGQAVRLTGEGVEDPAVDRACRMMSVDLESGLGLSQAVRRQPLFPKGLARVLEWAEGNQSLAGSLHMVGEMFEARARSQATFFGTVLSVLVVIAVILFAGLLVIALFLPLITLISKLSG
jgi:type II secretory pathway component PulF